MNSSILGASAGRCYRGRGGGRGALADSWQDNVGPYLPTAAGSAISAVTQTAGTLSPAGGLGVFTAYLVVIGGGAAWRLKRHDA